MRQYETIRVRYKIIACTNAADILRQVIAERMPGDDENRQHEN